MNDTRPSLDEFRFRISYEISKREIPISPARIAPTSSDRQSSRGQFQSSAFLLNLNRFTPPPVFYIYHLPFAHFRSTRSFDFDRDSRTAFLSSSDAERRKWPKLRGRDRSEVPARVRHEFMDSRFGTTRCVHRYRRRSCATSGVLTGPALRHVKRSRVADPTCKKGKQKEGKEERGGTGKADTRIFWSAHWSDFAYRRS